MQLCVLFLHFKQFVAIIFMFFVPSILCIESPCMTLDYKTHMKLCLKWLAVFVPKSYTLFPHLPIILIIIIIMTIYWAHISTHNVSTQGAWAIKITTNILPNYKLHLKKFTHDAYIHYIINIYLQINKLITKHSIIKINHWKDVFLNIFWTVSGYWTIYI